MNRRKFIKNITRGSVLTGLGTMSALFMIRNRRNQNTQCNYDFVCRNCHKTEICMLPQAALFKFEKQAKLKK